jgi:hypothetical protein
MHELQKERDLCILPYPGIKNKEGTKKYLFEMEIDR